MGSFSVLLRILPPPHRQPAAKRVHGRRLPVNCHRKISNPYGLQIYDKWLEKPKVLLIFSPTGHKKWQQSQFLISSPAFFSFSAAEYYFSTAKYFFSPRNFKILPRNIFNPPQKKQAARHFPPTARHPPPHSPAKHLVFSTLSATESLKSCKKNGAPPFFMPPTG